MVMFSDEELQQMRNKLNAMSADNQRLKEQLAAAGNKTPESGGKELGGGTPSGDFPNRGKPVEQRSTRQSGIPCQGDEGEQPEGGVYHYRLRGQRNGQQDA